MKQVLIDRYGAPEEVARCADVPDVGAPGAGEVGFDVLLFPINPADVSFCRGTYRLKPTLPATPGAECIGRVTAVGAGVSHVKAGDLVINLQRENWTQKRRVKVDDVIPVPAGMDLQQAAMLRINPPTALLMLADLVDLKPGDWVIQNVANSAVGRLVIKLAKQCGAKTMNVVRRESLLSELKALRSDDVIPVPAGMDLQQAAMLRINPPTALLMLADLVDLKPGDWVIQNVANSAVGRLVIKLAKQCGAKTMNVVRRESLFSELKAL